MITHRITPTRRGKFLVGEIIPSSWLGRPSWVVVAGHQLTFRVGTFAVALEVSAILQNGGHPSDVEGMCLR